MPPEFRRTARSTSQLLVVVATLVVLLWTVIFVAGCDRSDSRTAHPGGSSATTIVTTTGMVRDMVLAMVGSDADVQAIMGAGVDPHLYQPTRGDSVKLLNADIVVYNGLHLEGRLGEVMERRNKTGGTTIAVGELLGPEQLMSADAGVHDPHIWMDVALWSEAAGLLAEQLAAALPDHAGAIRDRSAAYRQQLAQLDQWGASAIESIPPSQRVLVTAHDAFRYFGRRYGVEVHGVQGVSTASTAAISDINRLVDLIVTKSVPAVFFESSVSPRQVKAIVEGAQQHGHNVSSDSTLLSDSMGADGTPQGTYVGMMQHNFRTIATALGGKVNEFMTQSQARPTVKPMSPATTTAAAVSVGAAS